MTNALKAEIEAWIEADPDPRDRARLAESLAQAEAGDTAAQAELAAAFAGPLAFGTAGLRGELGPGPARMNRAVVIRAAAGLMAYLDEVIRPPARAVTDPGSPAPAEPASLPSSAAPKVVIGYDARRGSRDFAVDTAAVVTAAGGRALLWEQTCPTPLLAYAVREL
ncbi:MAG: hypothetical protein LBU05_02525, partial [Bifidobacteriaceae bacterium]|nr:hypothetical protein [Bifidobacteriaceae bacterium]